MKKQVWLVILFFSLVITACAPASSEPTLISATNTVIASLTPTPVPPTSTATPIPLAPMSDFMKGIVYYPAGWGGDQRPTVEWILKNVFIPTGATWIRLHIGCYQETVHATAITCDDPGAWSDEDIISVTKTAHKLGLRVMIENYIMLTNDPEHWAGDIGKFYTEEQWDAWFKSYTTMETHFADLAEKNNVDYMVIISELDSTVSREKEWRNVISSVRAKYHGPVTAAFDEEYAFFGVQFWDALDSIGIHPYYFHLRNVSDPTVEQLKQAWLAPTNRLEVFSKKWDRPILITEIGYWSVDRMTQDYNLLDSTTKVDLQEQSNLFQALFETFTGKDWVIGIFPYALEGSANFAEASNVGNAFNGKPAENVIRSFYGAAPFPTSTLVIPPPANMRTNMVIYDDVYNSQWTNYPPGGVASRIDMQQTEIAVSGSAIRAELPWFETLDMSNDNLDWSKYQWLDFDLYVDPNIPSNVLRVSIVLRDINYQTSPFKVELTHSQFLEGSDLLAGVWQHVQIPLDVFGPLIGTYRTISISNVSKQQPIVIYVDNVNLRGE